MVGGGESMKTELTTDETQAQLTEREFLKYTFFKLNPEWRRLPDSEKAAHKEQFASIVENFSKRMILKSYSLMGTRGDADFMFWTISRRLEDFQEFISSLLSSGLGRYLETPYSYLAITRQSEYLGGHRHEGQEGASLSRRPGESKYLFVYPFTKKREWYFLSYEDRRVAMAQHFKIGHKYPTVKIHTGYSFGLDDQEFVLAFETDNPADFSELVMELRSSEASRYTALEIPLFTCIAQEMPEILNLLG
jgi:chlorite dismutase